ncbi:MAG: hypothetical protein MSA89_06070, partial [Clostridium sp.]|nr:hypothetical protein [Clostridium sp.]
MNTRVTNKIQVDESFFNEVVILNTKQRIKEAIKKFDVLKKEIENLIKKSNWVKIGNKDVYYESTENAIIPDITKIELALCNKKFISEFEDFKGELITKEQVLNLFFDKVNTNPFMNNNTYEYKFLHNGEIRIRNILRYRASDNSYSERIRLNDSNLGCRYNDLNWTRSCTRCNLYCNCLKIPVVNLNKSLSKLELFLQNNIYPEAFSKDLVDEFNLLLSLYSKGYIKFEGENIVETDKFIKDVLNQEFLELNKVSFKKEEILDFIKSNKVNLDDDLYKLFSDSLLNCEK